LANAAAWPARDAQRFTDALVRSGFIDQLEDGGYVLHDWFDYAGKLNEQRARNRARKAAARTSGGQAPEVRGTGAGNPGLPDRTGPDSTEPTEPDDPPNPPLNGGAGPPRRRRRRRQAEPEPECSCTQRREWLTVNKNTNPVCDIHGDVRELAS
jgi:hypothetical protein